MGREEVRPMELTIDLSPDEEVRLRVAAEKEGLEPEECARRLLTSQLPSLKPGEATRALFAAWAAEDATDDPEEIARRNQEWEELKAQMNATRAELGAEPLFP
jgi:hypothetical protein